MLEPLTEREHEILLLVSRGMSNRDIADTLVLARGTIKAHCHNIYSKLGVSNRTQALLKAQELGLLTQADVVIATRDTTSHLGPAKSNLPSSLTPFIGRKVELARLTEMLNDERVRLITVLGTGGMGKTRLAIEFARQQVQRFKDGVFFIALARVSDAKNLASAMIDDLGLRFQTSENPEQQLLNYLRHRQMLLVLDNFEHLLEGATFLAAMLRSAPDVKLIVTSRERLNLSPEVVFVLGGLHYSSEGDAAHFMQSEAAQLLVERASDTSEFRTAGRRLAAYPAYLSAQ